jgi:anthranilate/para-aminobenzoate synthase component I
MPPLYKPSLEDLRTLAKEGGMIAVHRELPADLETPVSVYLKLTQQATATPSFLLESVERGEQVGRYSFIGVDSPMTMTALGDQVIIGGAGGAVLETVQGDPLTIVKELMAGRHSVKMPGLPRFNGGVVGYFGYDLVRFMERLPATATRTLDVPDMVLLMTDNLVVFDHVRHKLIVIANMRTEGNLRAGYADAIARIDSIISRLNQPLVPPQADQPTPIPLPSTGRCGCSTRRPICSFSILRGWRGLRANRCISSVPARRCTCGWKIAPPSSTRLLAPGGGAKPRPKMINSPRIYWKIPRSGPSMSCWSIWGAMIWGGSVNMVPSACRR